MSRSKRVIKVHCFPRTTVSDMEDYLKPLIKKRPAKIILHCGTNDLNTSQPGQVAEVSEIWFIISKQRELTVWYQSHAK